MGRRIGTACDRDAWTRTASLVGAFLSGVAVLGVGDLRAGEAGRPSVDQRVLGRALFEREWLPGDSRAHGGDGLGPVYNDSSCIACHNLGGTGGGGPASKNVDIITASPNGQIVPQAASPSAGEPGFLGKALGSLFGLNVPEEPRANQAASTPAAGKPAGAARSTTARWSRLTRASGRRGASSSIASAPRRGTKPGGSR